MSEQTEFDKIALGNALDNGDGSISAPVCCSQQMNDVGGCSDGCCDDWKCGVCGKKLRSSYGD